RQHHAGRRRLIRTHPAAASLLDRGAVARMALSTRKEAHDVSDPMAHPHRRSDDPDDGKRHLVQTAVDSTLTKALARYGVPIFLAWMAWQGREALEVQKRQGADIAQVKSD